MVFVLQDNYDDNVILMRDVWCLTIREKRYVILKRTYVTVSIIAMDYYWVKYFVHLVLHKWSPRHFRLHEKSSYLNPYLYILKDYY